MLVMNKLNSFLILVIFMVACGSKKEKTLFELIPASDSGIDFANNIEVNDTLNFIEYTYVYNGAGLGVGDFNNDGLQDVFFAGNQVGNRLYINEGELKFEDVTEKSGISPYDRWCTGVALVDINTDGWLDVYVAAADINETERGKNLLFINNGDLTFTEMGEAYGIADLAYSTQGAFFDYDKDGDLDLYVLNNYQSSYSQNTVRPKVTDGSSPSNDHLYRNDGPGPDGHPVFRNVTLDAGITIEGHGLGIAVADLNLDTWPDIYIANDFLTNDLVWINQQDGTFINKAPEYTKHQTHNGMGTDVNDFNNDGLPDIVVLDMLPPDNFRKKTMLTPMNYDRFFLNLEYNYEPQYVRNTLQLHNGIMPDGDVSFSEIGELAGIQATDWSWAPLFADYDNDGFKDLWITNGYRKDVTDLDFIVYESQKPGFASGKLDDEEMKALGQRLQSVRISNFMFRNKGDLTFSDETEAWGLARPSFSNGTAFADFDNDGDLDLVINNIDDPAFLYRNNLNPRQDSANHYLQVNLNGPAGNPSGLGTKLIFKTAGQKIYHDHSVYRGYKSTVENKIHVGLGSHALVDTIEVYWLDGRKELLTDIKTNHLIDIDHKNASQPEQMEGFQKPEYKARLFQDVSQQVMTSYEHQETDFVDFKFIPLLPKKYSQAGPGMAVGDLNGDGREDLVLGAAVREKTNLYFQNQDGTFTNQSLPGDSLHEDMGILVFDADQDQDLDLFVVSGSVEFFPEHEAFQDRLYLNDGRGNFEKSENSIPEYISSGTVVTAADYDHDGDLDLFIGGNVLPRNFPTPSKSHLLRNDEGTFVDVTDAVATGLSDAGIVNCALWTDFNNDGWKDLIVAGDYMPISFYANQDGKLENVTEQTSLNNTQGWWNSISGEDFDQDGDIDYVLGNFGLNNKYKPSENQPVRLYVNDFDGNGTKDPIMTYYIQGQEQTAHPRDAMIDQMNLFRGKFNSYQGYANASLDKMFKQEDLQNADVYELHTFASSYLENKGNGEFILTALPTRAQLAPVYGIQSGDFNQDGFPDILLVGNSRAVEISSGWQDAFIGSYLQGDGKGNFEHVPVSKHGFLVEGDAKAFAEIYLEGKPYLMITHNRGPLQTYDFSAAADSQVVDLKAADTYAMVTNQAGKTYKKEFYFGSGYLSQNSRKFRIPADAAEVTIMDTNGNERSIALDQEVL